MRGIIIKEDNTYEVVEKKKKFSLEEMQHIVDGYIEGVMFIKGSTLYVNEEGKFSKGINKLATAFWGAKIYQMNNFVVEDFLAGDVLYIGEDGEGEQVGLTDKQILEFLEFHKDLNEQFSL